MGRRDMALIAIYGAGQLGQGVAAVLTERGRHQVKGPHTRDERIPALTAGADLVVIATTTRLRDVVEDIRLAVAHSSNVIVSAEESANPWLVDPDLAEAVHREAVDAGVTVVGAGLNPGLIFDALVLTILGAAPDDVQVTVRRTVDISRFGPAVHARIGIDLTPDEFDRGVGNGQILGHAGFPQSMSIVGRALGRDIGLIETSLKAVLTDEDLPLPDGRIIRAGRTAGVDQLYRAIEFGAAWYTASFVGHVAPASAGLELSDVIVVHRGDDIIQEVRATPCFPSQVGSQHVIANSVDRVIAAPSGWLTVADLPPASNSTSG